MKFGPSNDEPSNVQEEIEAAAMSASWPAPFVTDAHRNGWTAHRDRRDPPANVGISWRAGWLAREIWCHDRDFQRDVDAWPWNRTRSVANQGPRATPCSCKLIGRGVR